MENSIQINLSKFREFENNTLSPEEKMSMDWFKESFYESPWIQERPAHIKQAFYDFPPWNFYKCICCGSFMRIKGFYETTVFVTVVDAYQLGIDGTTHIPAKHTLNQLIKLDKWSDEDINNIDKIASFIDPKINPVFRHPLGYNMLKEHHIQKA